MNRWKTATLIEALDHRGVRCSMVLDGAVNRGALETFMGQILVSSLRHGDLVAMDNLSSHKGPRVAERIRAAGAELVCLPPYSPDLNPIEPAFSKINPGLRNPACRMIEPLWTTMQSVLDTIAPSDAQGYFRHAGYATDKLKPL